MGRVPLPGELTAGHISLQPRHREAGSFILGSLFPEGQDTAYISPAGEPLFRSAMVYGSAVDEGPGPTLWPADTSSPGLTIRSDLDLLVVRHPGEAEERFAAHVLENIIKRAQASYGLVVEPKLYPAGGSGARVDPLYAEHIVEIGMKQPTMSINNPAQEFRPYLLELDDRAGRIICAFTFFDSKAESFAQDPDDYFINYRRVQRALEFPSASGRKGLPATKLPGEALPHISNKAGMRALLEHRIQTFPHFGNQQERALLLQDQRELAAMDLSFTGHLTETLVGIEAAKAAKVSTDRRATLIAGLIGNYEGWIEDNARQACEKAERLSRAWTVVLEKELALVAPERLCEIEGYGDSWHYGVDDHS